MKFKKNTYKLHRYFGLAVMLPLSLWAISGIMHPFIANWFRPEIAKTFLLPETIDENRIKVSLKTSLDSNGIQELQNSRLIAFENDYYYQVNLGKDSLVYLHAETGLATNHLDQKYAEQLGRQFLEDSTSELVSAEKLDHFTSEYREINRFLPVWKLTFNRPDGMELYVATGSSRLGAFNTTSKRVYLHVFNFLHNWGFIPNTPFRLALIVLFSFLIFLTAVAGLFIYGFGRKAYKRVKVTSQVQKKRRSHRRWGLATSVFMLLFSFSGCYHAFMKFEPDVRQQFSDKALLNTQKVNEEVFWQLFQQGAPLVNFSLAKVEEQWYYRVQLSQGKTTEIRYVALQTGDVLAQGDKSYAQDLALQFSQLSAEAISETQEITRFKGEYGFINKRLPVQKVQFATEDKTTYYIETSTGKLSAIVLNKDRWEGYSFAFLHKFHFLDGLGKNFRDTFALLAALFLVVVCFKGFQVYLK